MKKKNSPEYKMADGRFWTMMWWWSHIL